MSREPGVSRVERVFRNARAAAGGPLADLAVGGGRFLAVTPAAGAPAGPPGDAGHPPIEEVNLEGRVVLPGFIESHIHLDKAFLEERRPNLSGTLRDAIAITLELKRAVTKEDIRQRSERALRLLLRHGTTRARLQVEVDPIVRLRGMEAALELREAWRGRFGLQLVVFPQEGIEQQPGTEGLMREAMRMGGDAVGGVPYNDTDPERHLDIVFKLAGESGKGVDLHLDFTDDPGDRRIESVCRRTLAAGLQGRVAVGHLTSLGAMDEGTIARIAGLIAEAGIHVLPLPATDLFLCGRGPVPPRHRSLTPVKALLRAGANVSIASNNIRNAFTPSGRGDLCSPPTPPRCWGWRIATASPPARTPTSPSSTPRTTTTSSSTSPRSAGSSRPGGSSWRICGRRGGGRGCRGVSPYAPEKNTRKGNPPPRQAVGSGRAWAISPGVMART
ncbi:MAG: amidohydrolase family protein [Candidatus Tectomicrobia bacterium]|nr:amidohydrolase family protein [Candidatus Tectomicrobia bacterium]